MRVLLGAVLALGLAGSAAAQGSHVPAPVAIKPLEAGATVQPVSLARMAANIEGGTPWAEMASGSRCVIEETRKWDAKNNRIQNLGAFEKVFREAFAKQGLKVSGDPTNLFVADDKGSDLQVGALITRANARLCARGTFNPVEGGFVTMDVEWQIFSVSRDKVVARITTHGGYEVTDFAAGANANLIAQAFGDSAARLAANEEFRRIVTTPLSIAPPPVTFPAMRFAPAMGAAPISGAVKGVVSIFAGEGMGSGVLISPDGYILTNHHVAGEHGQVRIHWADGTDTVGEVLRADRRRDVALIKTTPKAPALTLRKEPAELGEPVFAVGTPLEKDFQNTLTKGIVSASRLFNGQPFIQSDVAVDHGNSGGPLLDEKGRVLGLTDLVYTPDGVSHNINLFIPIEDALRVLALSPLDPPPVHAPVPPKTHPAKKR